MLKNKTTSKLQKIVGTETYINANTGEVEEFQVTTLQDKDFNFNKIWLANVLQSLDIIGNKQMKVAFYLLDNLNKENMFIGSNRIVAEQLGFSLQTVSRTFVALQRVNFIKKVAGSVYIVNPDMLFKGSHKQRLNILNQYNKQEKAPLTDEQKLENLISTQQQISKEIAKIQQKINSKVFNETNQNQAQYKFNFEEKKTEPTRQYNFA